jgi:hypothetical protein
MGLRRAPEVVIASAEERHEWESFLALLPLFDLREIEAEKYRRCLREFGLCPGSIQIGRDELKTRTGLGVGENGSPALDLILASLVREGVLVPIKARPFQFRIVQPIYYPSPTYEGADERSMMREQAFRLRVIRKLERRFDDPSLPTSHAPRLREDLDNLVAVYEASWLAFKDGVGAVEAGKTRLEVETQVDGSEQLVLAFPEKESNTS